jgi:hypothetical protein
MALKLVEPSFAWPVWCSDSFGDQSENPSTLKAVLLAPFLLFPFSLLMLLVHLLLVLLETPVAEVGEQAKDQQGEQREPEEDRVADRPVSRGALCPAMVAALTKKRYLVSAGTAAEGSPKRCTTLGAPSRRGCQLPPALLAGYRCHAELSKGTAGPHGTPNATAQLRGGLLSH